MKRGDIWLLSLGTGAPTLRPLLQTPATEQAPEFSPDGRAVAYQSDESGRWEVYVQPYPGPGPRIQVSVDGGVNAAWNPKGEELFFVRPGDPARGEPRRLMLVSVRTHAVLDVGRPRPLFDVPVGNWACSPVRCHDVAPDGQGFFVVTRLGGPPPPLPPVTHIHLIQNWVEELKAKVPGGR